MVAQLVIHLPPTSGVCGSSPGPYMGKLVVAYRWSAVYSTKYITHEDKQYIGSHGGHGVVIHSPPTSGVHGSNPEPYVGKLVVAYRWSAVYSTEP